MAMKYNKAASYPSVGEREKAKKRTEAERNKDVKKKVKKGKK